jgi:hypothetical protein
MTFPETYIILIIDYMRDMSREEYFLSFYILQIFMVFVGFIFFYFLFGFKICTKDITEFNKMLTSITKRGYRSARCRSQYSTSLKPSPPKLSRLLNSRLNLSLLTVKL